MSIGIVFATLKSLVNNRCYPDTFPQGVVYPAIRYQLVDGVPLPSICGTDGGESDDSRVQIDCVAVTVGAAESLRDQVIVAMNAVVDPPTMRDIKTDDYDPDTKMYIRRVDYFLNPSSPALS